MKDSLVVEYRSTDELIPYVSNSRTHSDEQVSQVAASIQEFGFTNPILIDDESGVIAGHGRLLAAKKLGLSSVPTIKLSGLTKVQKKAYVIADNKLALNSGWDSEMLRVEIQSLQSFSFDISLLGFEADELIDIDGFLESSDKLDSDGSTKEIDTDDFGMAHQCPKCGFEYD